MRLVEKLRWVRIRAGLQVADAGRYGKFRVEKTRQARWYASHEDETITDPPGRVLMADAQVDANGTHGLAIAHAPETVGEHLFSAVVYAPGFRRPALIWAYTGSLDRIVRDYGKTPVGLAIRAYLDLTGPAPTLPHVRGLIADALAEPRLIPILRDALEDAGSPLLAAIDRISEFLATYG